MIKKVKECRKGKERKGGPMSVIDQITKEDLDQIAERPGAPAVSLYMPTHRAGPEVRQNAVRFKNLLARAEKMLAEASKDADDLLEPARKMMDDERFWSRQEDGLAVVISTGVFRLFRVPVAFEEIVVVSDHFHTKPLLAFLSKDHKFYIMALSQKQPRLLQCTRQNCTALTPETMPRGISDTLRYDDPERQLQFHTGTGGGKAKRSAVYHGQGVGIDESKDNVRRYVHDIHKAVQPLLKGENTPVVLAGLDQILSLYKETDKSLHGVAAEVTLNPDDLKDEELHARAWEALEPHFQNALEEELGRYHDIKGTGLASAEPGEIVCGAFFSRIDTLFLEEGTHYWGQFDKEAGKAVFHNKQMPGDRDLLDFAALHAFLKGGRVHVLDQERIPERHVCAIFRY
jgi:hypothetical protein